MNQPSTKNLTPTPGKRLVIFGCGYVGTAVARAALQRGLQVTALTRNEAKSGLLRATGIDTIVADLEGDSWHRQVPAAPDFVLNCVSSGGGGMDGYRRSYVAGMASIIAWTLRHGAVGTFVHTSSTSVYPQGEGALVAETSPTDQAGERGQLLLKTEALLRSANGSGRPPGCCRRWFILRLAGIYGPDRQHLVDQVRAGEVSGVGAHHLNLVQRDDIVAAIEACWQAPAAVADGIFNVVDDSAATRAEIVTWLAARLAMENPRFTGEPVGQRRSVTPDRVIANTKLKRQLGWRPRFPTFREGFGAILGAP